MTMKSPLKQTNSSSPLHDGPESLAHAAALTPCSDAPTFRFPCEPRTAPGSNAEFCVPANQAPEMFRRRPSLSDGAVSKRKQARIPDSLGFETSAYDTYRNSESSSFKCEDLHFCCPSWSVLFLAGHQLP
ncbi:hypothetical protein B0H19DRAFT_1244642 [Mycena capillaripes]|nr:hypothetical protein B0H19DRAFT_1244642 [Mycena capillaripes]